jgi:hypothetical protein
VGLGSRNHLSWFSQRSRVWKSDSPLHITNLSGTFEVPGWGDHWSKSSNPIYNSSFFLFIFLCTLFDTFLLLRIFIPSPNRGHW